MPPKRITFIVIPSKNGQVQEYRFSHLLPWIAGFFCLAFIGTFAYYTVGYYQREDQQYSLDRLQAENSELMRKVEVTKKFVAQLGETMDELVEVDEKLRAWHEMEPLSADERLPGVGGPEILQDEVFSELPLYKRRMLEKLNVKIERLQREAKYQEESFRRITKKFLASGDSLRHIPTIFPAPQAWQSSPFGDRNDPFTGRKAKHTGIDFAGRKGTPIMATADGIVTHAYPDRRLGNVIVIEHDIVGQNENGETYHKDGIYRTEYGHLEKMLVKKDDRVKRGDQIGTMGNTGRSTGPHLHYSVRYQDRTRGGYKGYIDPGLFLLDIQPRDKRVAGWLRSEE
jgi:murein DD-endopeptidase MepM/ murein hydrolase activator NlpD